jgi:molybdopterin synthase catalytic subunit
MHIEVRGESFSPWVLLGEYEQQAVNEHSHGKHGATAVFVGTMRDFNEGDAVQGMFLEHYPGMTEKALEQLAGQAVARHDLLDVLLVHRVGELLPGEPIVLVAVWSAHRKQAFEACRELMEQLKSQAPFWKREQLNNGHRWVDKNTAGY